MTILKTKILATMMVAIMTFSGAVVMMDSESNDAATWEPNGTGDIYSYTLHYDSSEMGNTAAQELQLTVANMTPISHTAGTTTLSSVANEGSWGFDTTTGIGPFNSFYAAFDMTDGNKFVAVLNPYNLTETIDGVDITSSLSNYNIMWVLPTVYWKTESNGDITLTNDRDAGGIAYAHTINGIIREYVAYGVYEASTKNVGGQTVLTSQSGVLNTTDITKGTFRTYANNNVMDSSLGENSYAMLWNFYQWELYKYISYVVMEGFDSQSIVGNGIVYGGTYNNTTGSTNTLGPYAGQPGDITTDTSDMTTYGESPVKLFIENAWGSAHDFVDGVYCKARNGLVIDTSNAPTDTDSGNYVETITFTIPSNGFVTEIKTTDKLWGFASTRSYVNTLTSGTTDVTYVEAYDPALFTVGGSAWYSSPMYNTKYGISSVTAASNGLEATSTEKTTRLAFVYGSSIAPADITIQADDTGYGTVSTGSISTDTQDSIIINGTTMTIAGTDVTATITSQSDAQYTYSFDGWYDDSTDTKLTGTIPITGDMTIIAKFTRTLNEYTITWNLYDDVTDTTQVPYGTVPTYTPPTRDGYDFLGWNPTPVAVTGTATYTAEWYSLPVAITFNTEGGSMSTPTQVEYLAGATFGELPTPTKNNYTFKGWFTAETGGEQITSESIVPDVPTTYYAQYDLNENMVPVKTITDMIPLIVLIGILLGATLMITYGLRSGWSAQEIIYVIIGLSVAILVFVMILMPIMDSMW